MSSDNNIVALAHESTRSMANKSATDSTSYLASIDATIKRINNCVSLQLGKHISQLFDNAESILSSEKYLSELIGNENKIQQNYIEEMQIFCRKKEQTKITLNIEVLNQSDISIKTDQTNKEMFSINDTSALILSVQGEHIEESVAIAHLVAKVHKLYKEQLGSIEKRFSIIVANNNINKNNIPFGPEQLCRAFKKSLNLYNPSTELILIIYSLFDKHVVLQLGHVYNKINSIMSEAGVLPKLISEPSTDPYVHFLDKVNDVTINSPLKIIDNQKEITRIVETHNKIKRGDDVFGTLQHLVMMKKRMSSIRNPNEVSLASSKQQTILVESKSKSDFTVTDLVDSINELQQNKPNNLNLDSAGIMDYVIQKHYKYTQILSKKWGSTDENTVALICMLFDSIKQDTNLPANMKTTIARLKLPIIKVALSDKEFFNNTGHPARLLINKLAFSAICWNEMNNINEDPLYKKVDYIISRIINDVHLCHDIYSKLTDELTQFLNKYTASKRIASQSPKKPDNESDNIALKEIEKYSSSIDVPETLKKFLATAWKNVLSHIHSNIGESSLTWQYALSITAKLISSTQPKLTKKEKKDLLIEIPIIVNGLQDGLTLISYNRTKIQQFLNELELIHMASLKGELIDIYDLSFEETAVPSATNDQTIIPEVEITPEMLIEEIDEITNRMDNKKNVIKNDESDAYLETINQLAVGTWIEFTEENNKRFRSKLAWKNRTTGEFSFVDSNDNIITEKTLTDLVTDFRNGHIHIIADSPLIDRTLDNIRIQLKNFVYKHNTPDNLTKS